MNKLIKSTQEQATASWINYLNQVRINELIDTLKNQGKNFANAIKEINWSVKEIDKIINTNRGGEDGIHGFIAEVAEKGVRNARMLVNGELASTEWINNNGPIDLVRDGFNIQQKFVQSGGKFSLNAIKEHSRNYPDFLDDKTKYQIPKDYYNTVNMLRNMTEKEAYKTLNSTSSPTIGQWRSVNSFFEESKIKFEDLEPSKLDYDSVQKKAIRETIKGEKESLKETNKKRRVAAYEKSKPTVQEGLKATAVSAVIEGGTTFCISIVKKIKQGKHIKDFTEEDWKEIAGDTGIGTLKGGVRGASIYVLTNFKVAPAAVASAVVTASFGIAEQLYAFRKGKITETQFIENSEMLSLDAAVSGLSSLIGQISIPVPVLGAVIGNAVGTVIYQTVKNTLTDKEQKIILGYIKSIEELDKSLEVEYQQCVIQLKESFALYLSLIDRAFSVDVTVAFEGSIELAKSCGVPTEEILYSANKIKSYFIE